MTHNPKPPDYRLLSWDREVLRVLCAQRSPVTYPELRDHLCLIHGGVVDGADVYNACECLARRGLVYRYCVEAPGEASFALYWATPAGHRARQPERST